MSDCEGVISSSPIGSIGSPPPSWVSREIMAGFPQFRLSVTSSNKIDRRGNPFVPRPAHFLASLAIHAGVVFTLFQLSSPERHPARNTDSLLRYEVRMLPKQREVLWLPLRSSLSDVTPETRIGKAPQPQGRQHSPVESVIVNPPGASPGKQLVWRPETPARLETEVPAPNMIAVEGSPPQTFQTSGRGSGNIASATDRPTSHRGNKCLSYTGGGAIRHTGEIG